MADPRLNSMHLENLARRDDYRKSRDRILKMCGEQTLAFEPQFLEHISPSPDLPSEPARDGPRIDSEFSLADREVEFPLKVGLNTLGRLPDNDVPIPDTGVSRRHCAIVVHANNLCEIHDTASKNGTYLNGKLVATTSPLAVGDEVRVCERRMFLRRKTGRD